MSFFMSFRLNILHFCFILKISVAYSQQRYDSRQDLSRVFDFAPNLRAAVDTAKTQGKPIMLFVHRSTCPACKKLLPQLTSNSDVKTLGKNFVVVHSIDNSDPDCEREGPSYFPRLDQFEVLLNRLTLPLMMITNSSWLNLFIFCVLQNYVLWFQCKLSWNKESLQYQLPTLLWTISWCNLSNEKCISKRQQILNEHLVHLVLSLNKNHIYSKLLLPMSINCFAMYFEIVFF